MLEKIVQYMKEKHNAELSIWYKPDGYINIGVFGNDSHTFTVVNSGRFFQVFKDVEAKMIDGDEIKEQ